MAIRKLVLVRHGESQWNQENRFTGWSDIDLTARGISEALQAGALLKAHHFIFDHAFTSLLKRAIRTLWSILETLDQLWLPVEKSWRLNERHYGALQGLNKAETAQRYGDEQVALWRRSFSVAPPALSVDDAYFHGQDARYATLQKKDMPTTESLETTLKRVLPYWTDVIQPKVAHGERVIIVAHGNSLRALIKHLDNLSEAAIVNLDIPTGIPLIYEFNNNMRPLNNYYLGGHSALPAK